MAETIRQPDSGVRDMTDDQRRDAIISECRRQEESCLYTSTTLYIWLGRVRRQKQFFVVAPVILGALAGFSLLKDFTPGWLSALLAFSAGLLPALADALSIQTSVDETTRLASEYKSMQDRFRRTALITAPHDLKAAEDALAELMDRMDIARSTSITPPEWAFLEAQEKIKAGHYSFGADSGADEERSERQG
jgi:hypothetical protein